MEIYHNPRCQKSRQALQILQEADVDFQIRKYLDNPPIRAELEAVVKKLDVSPETLVRKNEKIYTEKYKGKELTDGEWIDAMVENPRLIQRPIVIDGDRAVIGRPPENVRELL